MPEPDRNTIAATILAMVAERGPGKTICPSEVAKALAAASGEAAEDAWRGLLKPVRAQAITLATAGRLGIYRKGKPLADPATAKGVIRLGPAAPS